VLSTRKFIDHRDDSTSHYIARIKDQNGLAK